ncbi:hypothetical protein J6590_031155 [Homalodisca vitripennis]|nr:hypothetical protein J6590_031155 [Homalodisca vitripennis]
MPPLQEKMTASWRLENQMRKVKYSYAHQCSALLPGEDAEECCRSRGSGTTKPQSNDALSEEVDDSNYCPVNGTEPRIDPTPRSRSPDSIYCRGSLLDGTLGL